MGTVRRSAGGTVLALVITASAVVAVGAGAEGNDDGDAGDTSGPPNIVFIMLDDVSTGYMDAMPVVRRKIANKGVEFTNGITPTSLCCPSRASTLTGKLAHTTGVYTNQRASGSWKRFRASEDDTIAVHLHDAGYRTGLFGKYINRYGESPRGYVPPGWDEFQAFRDAGYYDWSLGGTVEETYGARPVRDYSTDVLTKKAVQFIAGQTTSPDRVPFFLYYSPLAAHAPMIPAPRHRGTWHDEPLDAAFDEKDMSDKPRFMRKKARLRSAKKTETVQRQREQHEMLMSVDEGVAQIIDAIGPDEVANTLFIVMGDNGYLLGAHRLMRKNYPYVRSARVPMMIRWDGHIDSSIAGRLTTNTDMTATMAEAAGVTWPMDGISVFKKRTGTVMEQIQHKDPSDRWWHPGYCGYRTKNWLYIKWNDVKRQELYRYSSDPSELNNLAIKPRWDEKQKQMRKLAKRACTPVPPGFSW